MIHVFCESKGHCEEIAVFDDEATYISCLDGLEAQAERMGGTITESVDPELDIQEVVEAANKIHTVNKV